MLSHGIVSVYHVNTQYHIESPLPGIAHLYHECVNVPEVGVATQNLLGAFRAPVVEPPFLNF